MALHVTRQHLLHLAVDVQVDDRGIEPFLLAGDPGLFLLELDALRFAAATVDDGRNLARTTQAAARTLPLVLAAGYGEFLIGHLRSEEHTSELQSLMRISYAVFCLKKPNKIL